uniref:Mechanosensitive ion channel protein n=1 Tax=Entomoneis paludosa TaxID=265537 RepID=A0A7S2Y3U0_9STRA|mmetsp:Transcript_13327/g.27621  ORF Transcript_13327/g.27621 Transcript_13327/m.27621 type:complete len:538 (+) Transcript_13327:1169-2782(+)
MFSDENPSGTVTAAESYRNLIIVCSIVPLLVCIKRQYVGLHLGSRLYSRYNERLEEVMKDILLVSELALWARRKRDQQATYEVYLAQDDEEVSRHGFESGADNEPNESEGKTFSNVSKSQVVDLIQMLEPWQEPQRKEEGEEVSGKHIIEFRNAFAICTKEYFFSTAFGPVDSRAQCVRSADLLFRRILKLFGDREESIDINKLTDWMYKGSQLPKDKQDAGDLIELLEPDKDGRVYVIDFVGAIDNVYKKLRVLENAVNNASHIDNSYEKVFNFMFYTVVGCIALAVLGLNPLAFIASIATIAVSFGFMIGSGTSQLFEGVMLILARQPYDIGDKIAISEVEEVANTDGSQQWMVESIDLVTTTARLLATNEVASFSNGALARARIINMNRSPYATVWVHVRFAMDVPYSTILIFRAAVEKYVEERPQEWLELVAFRTNRVEAELNFVEYSIMLRHNHPWQRFISVKESRGAVASFCVEAQKQLGCHYRAPPMGIDIRMNDPNASQGRSGAASNASENENESLQRLLELAENFGPK